MPTRAPSVARLTDAFRDLTEGKAALIRAIIKCDFPAPEGWSDPYNRGPFSRAHAGDTLPEAIRAWADGWRLDCARTVRNTRSNEHAAYRRALAVPTGYCVPIESAVAWACSRLPVPSGEDAARVVERIAQQSWGHPSYAQLAMAAIDCILGTCGPESLADGVSHCNTGDTYTTTIIWDETSDRVSLESYGDWVERNDRQRD